MARRWIGLTLALLCVALWGCEDGQDEETSGGTAEAEGAEGEPSEDVELRGVDMKDKVLRIGALNDESGPAASIGKPYAVGKRVLAAQVNAGGSGLLPDGWTIELVEKDHGYNPQQSVQHYNAIKNDVLFIGTSFGTPNTLPLRDMLERDQVVAFPASLSSEMAEHEWTPPLGASYKVEAMRAMDWAVEKAGGKDQLKAAIVYQQDDYGKDGLEGWKKAAEHHGVEIVTEQTIAAGQQDMTAVISALKEAKADYVLLTTLPSATGPILGTAAKLEYQPTWIGNTPAWIDRFFDPKVIPSEVFGNFYWVTGLPYWGEELPGMKEFLAAYEKHGKQMAKPDFYILASYVQGLIQLEAFTRALEADAPVTGEAYLKKGVQTIEKWDADGLIQPVDLSQHPYQVSTRTRVLEPDMAGKTWKEAAPYADPKAL